MHDAEELMKRRLAPAVITMTLLGAFAVQAQAQPHGPALGVASGKAAIERFADRLTYDIASGRSAAPMSWQVFACGRHGTGAVCTGEWIFAAETCSVKMEALQAGPSVHVRKLGKLACSGRGGAAAAVAPAP